MPQPEMYDWEQDRDRKEEPRSGKRRGPRSGDGDTGMMPVQSDRNRRRRRYRGTSGWGSRLSAVLAVFLVLTAVLTGIRVLLGGPGSPGRQDSSGDPGPAGFPASSKEQTGAVPEVPGWIVQDLIPVNRYSRPGTPLQKVNGVVVHYVGNPGTTAEQNRSYFAGLADSHDTYASSHFLIGMDGTVIQCVPLDEISYCSNNRNKDTIAVECCHPDSSGKFTEETLDSLRKLLNWLIETYGLEKEDIIRHFDVTGKECPLYFVRHPDEWEAFRDSLTYPV